MAFSDLVNSLFPYAQSTSAQTGLSPAYILAQSAYETGGFTSYSANTRNNYFGISPGGVQAWYNSPADSFSAFANLINTSRYNGASQYSDPTQIASYLNNQGYSTTPTPTYAAGVQSWYNKIVAALGGQGSSPVNSVNGGGLSPGIGDPSGSTSGSGTTAQPTNVNDTVSLSSGATSWLSSTLNNFGIVLLAIVIVGVGLWMLAHR